MIGRVGVVATAVILSCASIAVGVAEAQETPQPLLSFSGSDPLAIKWADLEDGVTVELFNDATEDLGLTVRLTAFRRDQPPKRLVAGKVADVEPQTATVAAGDSAELTLKTAADATMPAPGSYRGSLVAFNPSGQAFARRAVVLTVPPAVEKAKPEPLADSLTVTVYRNDWGVFHNRLIDWGRYPHPGDVVLPLKTTSADVDLKADQDLGVIKSGSRIVPVSWDGTTEELDSGRRGIGLKLDGLDRPGEYEGKLDLLPNDDKAGDVTLKVVYTDFIWWPLIVLFLGVLTGWAVSHAVGVTVRYFDLRTRLGLLWQAFVRARKSFADASSGKTWAGYDLTPAVDAERKRLREAIEALRSSYAASIPDKKVDEVVDHIEKTREQVETLPAFASQLEALHEAVGKITTEQPEPPTDFPGGVTPTPEPAAVAALGALLDGHKLATLKAYEELKAKVDAAVLAAGKWLRLREAIRVCQARIEDLRPDIPSGQRAALDGAEADLGIVYDALWRSDPVDQEEPGLRESLAAVWQELGEIEKHMKPEPELCKEELFDMVYASYEPEASGAIAIAAAAPPPPPAPVPPAPVAEEEDAEKFAFLRDGLAWLLVGVAFLIAVATGLNSQYVGKAFGGSAWDYINLFVWGVGTKVALDLVVSGLGALSLIRLPRAG